MITAIIIAALVAANIYTVFRLNAHRAAFDKLMAFIAETEAELSREADRKRNLEDFAIAELTKLIAKEGE